MKYSSRQVERRLEGDRGNVFSCQSLFICGSPPGIMSRRGQSLSTFSGTDTMPLELVSGTFPVGIIPPYRQSPQLTQDSELRLTPVITRPPEFHAISAEAAEHLPVGTLRLVLEEKKAYKLIS